MGQAADTIGEAAKDTAAFFTGGTSGVNIARGEAPSVTTLAVDASGLAAGAGIAASGIAGTGGLSASTVATNQAAEDAAMGGAMRATAAGAATLPAMAAAEAPVFAAGPVPAGATPSGSGAPP